MKTRYNLNSLKGLCMLVFAFLLTTSTQAQVFLSPTECDSYTGPDGVVVTTSGLYTTTVGTTIYTIDLTILNSSTNVGTESISACDSYTAPDGTVYTADTLGATATVPNAVGCDSVITMDIDISTGVTNNPGGIAVNACDFYEAPSGTIYTSSGAFLDTVAGPNGCPVVTTYNLTIDGNANTGSTSVVSCGAYTSPAGNVYDSTGTYTDTLSQVASGCDSVLTIFLTVNSGDTESWTTEAISACDSYEMPGSGVVYTTASHPAGVTSADTVVTVGAAANGCNTIQYNTFTLAWTGNATSSDTTVTSCGSWTWGDSTWTATGTYSYPAGSNEAGCDSSVNVILTIEEYANGGCSAADSSAANGNNVLVAFGGNCSTFLEWNSCGPVTTISGAVVDSLVLATDPYSILNSGFLPNQAGYIDTIVDAAGCKTLYDYFITISDAVNADVFVDVNGACDSYTDENGTVYTANGLYTYVRANPFNGCDETVNLTITNMLSSTSGSIDVNACNDFTWNATTYDSTGTYTQTFTNAAGCDSVHTLNLTIGSVSTSEFMTLTPCDSYVMQDGSTIISSGVYTDVFAAANGCDSSVVLTVSMQASSNGAATFTGCSDVTYGDSTYTANTTVSDTLVASNGCDSVVTVTIDINSTTYTSTETLTACNSYTDINGVVYTANAVFTENLTTVYGCDSIVLTTLTIVNTIVEDTVTECGTFMVLPGSGDTVTVGGVYADTTASGLATGTCEDFTITHWLVVFGTATSTQDYHSCDGPYVWNGMTLSSDTTVDWSTTLANGCDSTATLNFTIGEDSPVSSEAITSQGPWTACDGTVYDVSDLITMNCGPNASGCDSIVTVALTVEPLSVDEVSSNVNIYPNPTRDGAITVELGTLTDVSVRVSNLVGEVVYQDNNISTPTYKLNINEAAGVYFVEVSNAADKKVFKLLVE